MKNIIVETDKYWGGDFKLHIIETKNEDAFTIYTLRSLDNKTPVGFELQIPKDLKTFGTGVIFRSSGIESDNFMNKLYSIYNLVKQENLCFTKSIECKYANLNDIPFKSDGEKRSDHINYIKVFFEGIDETEFAELFINIDEATGIIEFEEKAYEYRPYIAMFLTAD